MRFEVFTCIHSQTGQYGGNIPGKSHTSCSCTPRGENRASVNTSGLCAIPKFICSCSSCAVNSQHHNAVKGYNNRLTAPASCCQARQWKSALWNLARRSLTEEFIAFTLLLSSSTFLFVLQIACTRSPEGSHGQLLTSFTSNGNSDASSQQLLPWICFEEALVRTCTSWISIVSA